MKSNFLKWRERFDGLSLRERAIATTAILLCLYMAADFLIIQKLKMQQAVAWGDVKQWEKQIADVDKHIVKISQDLNVSPHKDSPVAIQELKNKLNSVQDNIDTILVDFIRPNQMVNVLKQLLEQDSSLKFMKLSSLGVQSLLAAQTLTNTKELHIDDHEQVEHLLGFYRNRMQYESQNTMSDEQHLKQSNGESSVSKPVALPSVYKHGVALEFLGTYVGTLNYLRTLEALPWRFYWDIVSYDVVEYPEAKIIINIYTLSLDKVWIGV